MPETRILKNISMYMALGQKSCRGTFYVLGEIVIKLFLCICDRLCVCVCMRKLWRYWLISGGGGDREVAQAPTQAPAGAEHRLPKYCSTEQAPTHLRWDEEDPLKIRLFRFPPNSLSHKHNPSPPSRFPRPARLTVYQPRATSACSLCALCPARDRPSWPRARTGLSTTGCDDGTPLPHHQHHHQLQPLEVVINQLQQLNQHYSSSRFRVRH